MGLSNKGVVDEEYVFKKLVRDYQGFLKENMVEQFLCHFTEDVR